VTAGRVSGTEGYAETAHMLLEQWKGTPFEEHHAIVMHLLPDQPARVADIGSGIGLDAAAFAAMGHTVVAVEPTAELRLPGIALHDAPGIEWLDDSLPLLAVLRARRDTFDLVMATAVWMHLDAQQRQQAMPAVAALLRPGGTLIISLRHGPVPPGRRMFDVSGEETIALAAAHGLRAIFSGRRESVQQFNRDHGVRWTHVAFTR
jgi:SAM-dependent methyltransferase